MNPRKRKHKCIQDEAYDEDHTGRVETPTNNLNSTEIFSEQVTSDGLKGYNIWLVRKPKNIAMEDLSIINFPKKVNSETCLFETNQLTENGYQILECKFERIDRPMFYVNARRSITNTDEKGISKPAKNIRGMVWICDTHNLTSEATTVTGNDDHPGFEPLENAKSIRRKPQRGRRLKERLKAFGTLQKECDEIHEVLYSSKKMKKEHKHKKFRSGT